MLSTVGSFANLFPGTGSGVMKKSSNFPLYCFSAQSIATMYPKDDPLGMGTQLQFSEWFWRLLGAWMTLLTNTFPYTCFRIALFATLSIFLAPCCPGCTELTVPHPQIPHWDFTAYLSQIKQKGCTLSPSRPRVKLKQIRGAVRTQVAWFHHHCPSGSD